MPPEALLGATRGSWGGSLVKMRGPVGGVRMMVLLVLMKLLLLLWLL